MQKGPASENAGPFYVIKLNESLRGFLKPYRD